MSDPTPASAPPPAPAPKWPAWAVALTACAALALFIGAAWLLWHLAHPAPAAFALPAEASGAAGQPISVTATAPTDVEWDTPDPGLTLFPSSMLRSTKTAVVWAAQPGRYRLKAHTAVGGRATPSKCCLVTVGSPPPVPPGPGPVPPGPGPNPPVPGGKTFFVVAVTDKAVAVPDLSAVLNAPALRKALADAGHTFRWLDKSQGEVQKAGLQKYVDAAGGVPALVLMQKAGDVGKVDAAVRLPATEQGILDAVRAAGGK